MIVVVSDLHFQDTATNGPAVSAANVAPLAFEQLWRQVDLLASRADTRDPVTIVLDGDILEILRSERWFSDGTRPYNFADGKLDPAAERTAVRIGDAILDENAAGLRALGGSRRSAVRFVYVYGNHDRLLRLDALAGVREELSRRLGGNVLFTSAYSDERHGVVIRHGHEFDWTNSEYQWSRTFDAIPEAALDLGRLRYAPLGDWIALEISTRAPHLAWQLLTAEGHRWRHVSDETRREIYSRLVELDDLRPQTEVLRWLSRPAGLAELGNTRTESEAISRFFGDLMNELVTLATPHVAPWLAAHGHPFIDRLALGAFELLGSIKYTASTLPTLMERVQRYLAEEEKPWLFMPRLPEWGDARYRFFVSGHTHAATVMPLRNASAMGANEGLWYMNTGTWRKTILRSGLGDDEYASVKQLAFATFFDAEESERSTGVARPTFDFWHGWTQRF